MYHLIQKLAEQTGAILTEDVGSVWADGQRGRHAYGIYKLVLQYDDIPIRYELHFGTGDVAVIHCRILGSFSNTEFEMTTRSQLSQLLFRKKPVIRITTTSDQLTRWMQKNEHLAFLEECARKDAFEPMIYARQEDEYLKIKGTYHLSFNNKENVLEPVLLFVQDVVDFYKKGDRNGA